MAWVEDDDNTHGASGFQVCRASYGNPQHPRTPGLTPTSPLVKPQTARLCRGSEGTWGLPQGRFWPLGRWRRGWYLSSLRPERRLPMLSSNNARPDTAQDTEIIHMNHRIEVTSKMASRIIPITNVALATNDHPDLSIEKFSVAATADPYPKASRIK